VLDVTVGERATLDIPALKVDPNAPKPTPGITYVTMPQMVTSHRVGAGFAYG
jgi:hypothetical protein